jgi:N6-L-threonylcarbamoyladenine synthase
MLNVGYPGGPALEQFAKNGSVERYALPRPLQGRHDCMMSFSGLKTAMRVSIQKEAVLTPDIQADLAASFQHMVAMHLCDKMKNALKMVSADCQTVVVAGGVAANQYICHQLMQLAHRYDKNFIAPPVHLCTDNAAMIAWAGMERFRMGAISDLTLAPRPRWPLSELILNTDK